MDNNSNTAYNRKKEPELNKQLIIDAATEIGAELDWHQVTFQAIADRTGLSKGGIIHHFRNKEELLDELMSQSLTGLTAQVEKQKANGDNDGALGYLQFVLEKRDDEKYKKTMRIVLQAIMINPKYNIQWLEWYNKHIMPANEDKLSIKSRIAFLVADGIWYAEHMGSSQLSREEKQEVFNYIKQLK